MTGKVPMTIQIIGPGSLTRDQHKCHVQTYPLEVDDIHSSDIRSALEYSYNRYINTHKLDPSWVSLQKGAPD